MIRRDVLVGLLAAGLVASVAAIEVRAQGTRADYKRARTLKNVVRGKVFQASVQPHWSGDNSRFWYRNDLPGNAREFVLVEPAKGRRAPAFDHAKVAVALSKAARRKFDARRLPIEWLDFVGDENAVLFHAAGAGWKCDLGTSAIVEDPRPKPKKYEKPGPPRRRSEWAPYHNTGGRAESPDGKWKAFVKDADLYLREKAGGKEYRLSTDGKPDDAYSAGVFWSPDSTRLVATRSTKAQKHPIHWIESSPASRVQPKLHSGNYLKPGDKIAVTKPYLFDVATRKKVPVSDELFPTPYRLGQIRWEPDGKRFTFHYNQRGHQVMRIIAVDGRTGRAVPIIDEVPKTFVNYAFKHFAQYFDKTGEIIWMSERDGWNHLYLFDSAGGKVKTQITRGRWVVRGVDRVEAAKRQIWFRAGGIRAGHDPYYVHYCRVNFDGRGLVILTEGDGTHSIRYSPDRKCFIDTYSRVDMPPITELRAAADGKLVCTLEKADISALRKTHWRVPERFTAKGRDGKTDIYGVIYRPSTFDPKKRYPVIERIYAGPQSAYVPKAFGSYYSAQSMAEIGFILVQIDGMGTSHRSKAFHDVCWKNLADAGLPDRIAWLKAAAKKYPQMDLSRVGIYGGSAGGQSAVRALLAHGDFYKVAVADCGCHDNRMDKIWWNEAWMSWPVGPHYAEQSNVTQAHRLQGKLLLIVGEMDKNVDPASTMQVVNALIKADKDFDLLVVPGAGHGVGSAPYGTRRTRDFFVRHLLGVEPRSR